ncbi:MAG: Crp/Fnr family transcriptional regulator [Thermodesulfobacteriota bacterium]
MKTQTETPPSSAPDAAALSRRFGACFYGFSVAEITRIQPYLHYRFCPQGTDLWQEDDVADFTGFLFQGKLTVKRGARFPGKFILLAVLEPGAIFGESAIAGGRKRSAIVTAGEDCHYLALSATDSDRLFAAEPELGIRLLQNILAIAGSRLSRAGVRLAELL